MCNCRIHTAIDDYIIKKKINDYTHDSEAAKVKVEAAITKINFKKISILKCVLLNCWEGSSSR